jgi:hypothetical protein
MFSLREFIKKGFLKAVENMPSYKIILNATGWYDKEILTEDDLKEINEAIEEYENSLKTNVEEGNSTITTEVEEETNSENPEETIEE